MVLRLKDLSVGDALPSLDRIVIARDVKAYADAAGGQHPLHQDDAFARSAGFDGIVAHGMFTMGHMAACLTRWAGEEATVTRISAQFRSPVYMDDRITAGGRIREIDREARSVTVELWVTLERDGATEFPIKRGEATIHVPDPG